MRLYILVLIRDAMVKKDQREGDWLQFDCSDNYPLNILIIFSIDQFYALLNSMAASLLRRINID